MATQTGERFGYVRRMSYPGEAWHIVDVPPTAHGEVEDAPTLCGYRPWLGAWGTISSRVEGMRVCSRCERVRRGSEAAG